MRRMLMVLSITVMLFTACAAAPLESNSTDLVSSSDEKDAIADPGPESDVHGDTLEELSSGVLTDEEIAGITFMREEEKLARDVYLELADLWGMNIFSNIASSEQTHMDAVLSLIEMAGVEDPAQDLSRGEFLNQELQTLYDDLIARGGEDLAEALLVGGAIEEIDILDLQEYLLETDNAAVIEVYQNLLKGSINHLKSFVRTYERQTGEAYQPQFLSEEAFDELVSTNTTGGSSSKNEMDSVGGRGQGRGRSN